MLAVKTLVPKSIIFRRTVRLMGDIFEISVVGNNPGWADDRIDEAVAEINRVEKLLSTFGDDSSINEINRNAGVEPVKADPEIFRLVDRAIQISELTHGVFDLTYYAAEKDEVSLADTMVKKSVAAVKKLNYKNVVLDAKSNTVFLKEKGMRIGFGANCKGYAADRAKYTLHLNGVGSGVINAGGDLLTWGLQPDNEPWTVGAADPSQRSMPFANVNISNMAIATSVNSEKYTASITKQRSANTKTNKGFSVSGIRSVTILSPTAELSDSMATPVMTIGVNAGLYMVNQLNQIACVIVDDQERVYTSKGINITN
jgi:thiamine biosynthesis lipoprotein